MDISFYKGNKSGGDRTFKTSQRRPNHNIIGMATYSAHEETVNFSRCSCVDVDLFTDILRECLSNEIPATQIWQVANANKATLKLNAEQWAILTDASTKGYSEFDITLLYTLTRNLTKITAPTRGWGKVPNNPAHTTLGDDIERIRSIRNEIYGHTATTRMLTASFNAMWIKMTVVCSRMEAHHTGM